MARTTIVGADVRVLEKVEGAILSDTGKCLRRGDSVNLGREETLFYKKNEVTAKPFACKGRTYYLLLGDLDLLNRENLQDQNNEEIEYLDTAK